MTIDKTIGNYFFKMMDYEYKDNIKVIPKLEKSYMDKYEIPYDIVSLNLNYLLLYTGFR